MEVAGSEAGADSDAVPLPVSAPSAMQVAGAEGDAAISKKKMTSTADPAEPAANPLLRTFRRRAQKLVPTSVTF